jgi:uncharacterized protein (TIGR04255 family)
VEGRPPILRNSPLQIVVMELRFPAAIYLQEDLKAVRKALKGEYPDAGTDHAVSINVSPEGAMVQQEKTQRHVYRTFDGSHQIGLTETSLVLEARGSDYEGFEHFLDRWLQAVQVVVQAADVTLQSRLGLRYANQLRVDDAGDGIKALGQRVHPALLSPFGADGFEFEIQTSLHEMRLRNDSVTATLRHGLQVPLQVPSMIPMAGQGIYVIDIDAYDDQPKPFGLEAHKESLKLLNAQVWGLFRWSISDQEFETMQPEDRE